MPDTKITALAAITTVAPANDLFAIVDVSDNSMAASGTTKNITTNQILGAGGTATLASATISGDLTVDTSTLKVDSANNRVGIGTASPATILDIQSAGGLFARIQNTTSTADAYLLVKNTTGEGFFGINAAGPYIYTAGALPIIFSTTGTERYRIASDGVATWSVGGSTAMTLNSTGLGVGGSPTAKISCAGYSSANQLADINIVRSSSGTNIQTGPNIVFTDGTSNNTVTIQNSQGRFGIWNYGAGAWNERLSVDSTGQVGIGVTPSAKLDVYQATLGTAYFRGGYSARQLTLTATSDGVNDGAVHTFLIGSSAGRYNFSNSSATLMTLDASGNLIWSPASTPPTLGTNGQLTVNATSNTNLRFSYRGSDGTTRVANITLA